MTTPDAPPKPRPPFAAYFAAVIVAALLIWSALPAASNQSLTPRDADWWTCGAGLVVWNDDSNHRAGVSIVSPIEIARLSGQFFRQLFPSAGNPWPESYLPKIRDRMFETLRIAFASSVFGAFLALWFSLIGARNLAAGRWVYFAGRALLNFIRTIPDLVLAAVLAVILSIGPLPGLVAMTIFSFGIIAKLLCDAVETVDPGPAEAIAAAGGSRLQTAVFAVLPQIAPDYVAFTLYSFEYNVRAATVLGLVGAGGIGMLISENVAFLNYIRLGEIIAVTFVAVFLIDSLSTYLRSKLV